MSYIQVPTNKPEITTSGNHHDSNLGLDDEFDDAMFRLSIRFFAHFT